MTVAAAGLLAVGLALMHDRPAVQGPLLLGGLVALWALIWRLLATGGVPWLLARADTVPVDPAIMNAALSAASFCPVLALAGLVLPKAGGSGAAIGVAWWGGFIAPGLGQGGLWPVSSVLLAAATALAAAMLGRIGRR